MTKRKIDLQVRFTAHLDASQKRDDWARRGLEWGKAGKVKQARLALKKAEFWDRRAKKLAP